MPIKDLPPDSRPREKLLARGASALSDTELLAILLRTGIQGKGVLQMADELLHIKNNSGSRTFHAAQGGFDGISQLPSPRANFGRGLLRARSEPSQKGFCCIKAGVQCSNATPYLFVNSVS